MKPLLFPLLLASLLIGCAQPDGGRPTGGTTPAPSRPTCDARQNEAARKSLFDRAVKDNVVRAKVTGVTFAERTVEAYQQNDKVVFEGDIILGEARTETQPFAIVRTGARYRWPGGRVAFQIESSAPNQSAIRSAIAHWDNKTDLSFVERDAANPAQFPNYIAFVAGRPGSHCSSWVGMRGGRQEITLEGGCGFGQIVHEIGHAIGLWHEQSREDRGQYVCINWDNIDPRFAYNFNQNVSDGDDIGGYDYDSIMHYEGKSFSINRRPTIVPLDSGVSIGQRRGLSAKDVAAVNAIY